MKPGRFVAFAALLFIISVVMPRVVTAEDAKEFLLAAGRNGTIQIMDPSTLETIATLHVDLPPSSAGLNGVAASPDGQQLYIWGPTATRPNICCYLYAVNMTTLEATVAADIPGSSSYHVWVPTPGIIYDARTLLGPNLMNEYPEIRRDAQMLLSPGHDALAALRSFRGPSIAVFDLRRGTAVQMTPAALPPENSKGNWAVAGSWSGDKLYVYVSRPDDPGWVWTLSKDQREMGEGVPAAQFGEMAACARRFPVYKMVVAASGRVYVYEPF